MADFGLVVRVRHVVFLNVAGVLSMAADAVKARLAHARALILRKKTGFVRVARPIEQDKDKKRAENEGSPTVADEIREIRVGDTGTDGRKVIGFRQMGRIPVPVWG